MSRSKGKTSKFDMKQTDTPRWIGGSSRAFEPMEEENGSPSRRSMSSSSPSTTPTTSPPSSCLSSENEHASSPEGPAMVLAGCPNCLMYVMLSQEEPKCPKCKNTMLLDFLYRSNSTKANSTRKTKKRL